MAELVFDLGMHVADDTAYYLAKGYDVVAVEANPALCAAAHERFTSEVEAGRLTIRNVGIAETSDVLDFWISNHSEWSSFSEQSAKKEGARATCIRVPTITFFELLAEYPPPVYVKVDIELNDSLCIEDLARSEVRPPYFSFEGHVNAAADINRLASIGYNSFKCIRQVDWKGITPENMYRQATIRKTIEHVRRAPSVGGRLGGWLNHLHYRPCTDRGWRFRPGSSGAFGLDLPGRWLSRDEMLAVWEHRLATDRQLGARGQGEWFDVHAAFSGAP